jgi:hypothetical protein
VEPNFSPEYEDELKDCKREMKLKNKDNWAGARPCWTHQLNLEN